MESKSSGRIRSELLESLNIKSQHTARKSKCVLTAQSKSFGFTAMRRRAANLWMSHNVIEYQSLGSRLLIINRFFFFSDLNSNWNSKILYSFNTRDFCRTYPSLLTLKLSTSNAHQVDFVVIKTSWKTNADTQQNAKSASYWFRMMTRFLLLTPPC